MLSIPLREQEVAPLTTFETDNSNSNIPFLTAEAMNEEREPEILQPQAAHKIARAACWSFCSATAIYTTKRLMVIHGYHYPLTIAFRSFVAILIVYTVLLRMSSESKYVQGSKRILRGLKKLDWDDFLFNSYWAPMVPASLAAAASLPMLLEGILHMPNLAVLIMLYPIVYTTDSFVLFVCCSKSRSQKFMSWEALFSVVASSIVLYNEYRLMVPGLVFGVGGILLMGVSRGLFIVGSERAGSDIAEQARLKAYHGFTIMTLVFGLLFSGITGYYVESCRSTTSFGIATVALMSTNLVMMVATTFSGTSILGYSPISFEQVAPEFSHIPVRGTEFLAPFASSLLLLLTTISSNPVSLLSLFQIIAYLVASICLIGAEYAQDLVLMCSDGVQQRVNGPLGKETKQSKKPSRVLTACVLFALLALCSSTIHSFAYSSIKTLTPRLPTAFDTAFVPPSRFEIVVSMYKEDPVSVRSMLEALRSTTFLATLKPRIIIYTKDPNQDIYELKQATGADVVERLDNLGREGGTYLWHIVNKWNELAEQTMFIQAHAHNMREVIPRINSYLVEETGMLSLGFTGVTCACNDCSDRWGWEDKWGVIPALYEKVYSRTCEAEDHILLTYKGQFVASARRIRGVRRKIFGGLLATITSKEGWSHDTSSEDMVSLGTDEDSPSNPYFGFTMERIWGLVMQCGTNAEIAARCPSLLSGMGMGGEVDDCQCLDVPLQ